MLARKDAEEAAIEELREKAKKELADWYKHNEEQLQATKATNRYSCTIYAYVVCLIELNLKLVQIVSGIGCRVSKSLV